MASPAGTRDLPGTGPVPSLGPGPGDGERVASGPRRGLRGHSQGVSVEVGEREAAVDLDIVVDYGPSIADVAAGVRRSVISAIESMTGLDVTEVNITVDDVWMPDDDDDSQSDEQPRVQ